MALMQLASVEEAIEALIALHDHQLDHNQHLRVSFSKSTIWPLTSGAVEATGRLTHSQR